MPTTCPICGSALQIDDNHTHLTCSNDDCPSRESGRIAKWCDKMKILEMGLKTIYRIQELGYFKTIGHMYEQYRNPEVYSVLKTELGKNYDNICDQIDSHKQATLAQFVSGYNIAGIGEKQVQKVVSAKNMETLEDLVKDKNPLRFVCDGIGEILSTKLSEGLERHFSDMKKTLQNVTLLVETKTTGGSLAGLTFCFTGKACMGRKELQAIVAEHGGESRDTVAKGLSYLVTDDTESGSSKNVKAKKLGIPVITSQAFLDMANS